MLLRPHSQEFIRNNSYNAHRYHLNNQKYHFNNQNYQPYSQNEGKLLLRKKIADFSFLPSDKIGRGYSSVVYKGLNDLTSIIIYYSR
jgi:hypothetical protein